MDHGTPRGAHGMLDQHAAASVLSGAPPRLTSMSSSSLHGDADTDADASPIAHSSVNTFSTTRKYIESKASKFKAYRKTLRKFLSVRGRALYQENPHQNRGEDGSDFSFSSSQQSSQLPRRLYINTDPQETDPSHSTEISFHSSSCLCCCRSHNPQLTSNYISTTKYKPYNAIPLFLYDQFCRFTNLYFLIVGILFCFDQLTPIFTAGRYSTLWTLAVMIGISAFKAALEDYRRWRQDKLVNNKLTSVWNSQSQEFQPQMWKHVKQADIIKVLKDEEFPADILVLHTSSPEAVAFVETKQLDGESNLKLKYPVRRLDQRFDPEQPTTLKGILQCENPNDHLYSFEGLFNLIDPQSDLDSAHNFPLFIDNILLRGTSLRNTNYVYGVVINTGHDTKIMQNMKKPPRKWSHLERTTNKYFLLVLALQIIVCIALTIGYSTQCEIQNSWYFMESEGCTTKTKATRFFNLFVMFSYIMPIALNVFFEICRVIQMYFINSDRDMYDELSDTYCEVRSSGLNEELGVVDYIFTDKTGTLTANKMVLQKLASPSGAIFPLGPQLDLFLQSNPKSEESSALKSFLLLLSLCHTVNPDLREDGTIVYQASSPDESALVKGAAAHGYKLASRSNQYIQVSIDGVDYRWDLLATLEFDSDRKRMSVVVRDHADGNIKVYSKGADSVMLNLIRSEYRTKIIDETIDDFAVQGLRTLVCATRVLHKREFLEWQDHCSSAATYVGKEREKRFAEANNIIESNLQLVGVTAIEDKLQEGVPDSLRAFERAGIKIWVLTGDKQETAMTIGVSCNIINPDMDLYVLNAAAIEDTSAQIDCALGRWGALKQLNPNSFFGLIIDGRSLNYALQDDDLRKKFILLAMTATSVIACRLTPKQKTDVVELIRREDKKAITLAIGDGGNDVGMIQAAHIGIGIVGLEGRAAKLASDFSIARFEHLKKLLLVHGRWCYKRMGKLALYTIYKSCLLTLSDVWFSIYSGYSGQTMLDPWGTGLFNVAFTSLPSIMLGSTDQEAPAKYLLAFPEIYELGRQRTSYNFKIFAFWLWEAVFQSMAVFFLCKVAQGSGPFDSGRLIGMWDFGFEIYIVVLVLVHIVVLFFVSSWTVDRAFVWIFSFTLFLWVLPIYCNIALETELGPQMYWTAQILFGQATVWMLMFIVPLSLSLPRILIRYWKRNYQPTIKTLVQECLKRDTGILHDYLEPEMSEHSQGMA